MEYRAAWQCDVQPMGTQTMPQIPEPPLTHFLAVPYSSDTQRESKEKEQFKKQEECIITYSTF